MVSPGKGKVSFSLAPVTDTYTAFGEIPLETALDWADEKVSLAAHGHINLH